MIIYVDEKKKKIEARSLYPFNPHMGGWDKGLRDVICCMCLNYNISYVNNHKTRRTEIELEDGSISVPWEVDQFVEKFSPNWLSLRESIWNLYQKIIQMANKRSLRAIISDLLKLKDF